MSWTPPRPGTRSAVEIRDDIVRERQELGRAVNALRIRWAEITDVRRQIRAHRTELLIGGALIGFLVGATVALGRRR